MYQLVERYVRLRSHYWTYTDDYHGQCIKTPAPVHKDVASNCNKFHLVEGRDS